MAGREAVNIREESEACYVTVIPSILFIKALRSVLNLRVPNFLFYGPVVLSSEGSTPL